MGSLAPLDLARIRTVAIISAVGESFAFERVRPLRFEWFAPPDTRYLEISDWKIDDDVTRDVTSLLPRRVAIKKVFFQRTDFGTWNYAILRQNIFKLNGDPGIDAYILILRDWHYDAIGHSVHDLQGLGLYRRDTPTGDTSGRHLCELSRRRHRWEHRRNFCLARSRHAGRIIALDANAAVALAQNAERSDRHATEITHCRSDPAHRPKPCREHWQG